MRRVGSGASPVAALVFVVVLVVGALVPNVRAQTTPDRSDVVGQDRPLQEVEVGRAEDGEMTIEKTTTTIAYADADP